MSQTTNPSPQVLGLPLFMRARQVCQVLQISKSTLYSLLSSEKFPPGKRIGGSRIWATVDVLAFVQAEER